jgi:hypothetical protein
LQDGISGVDARREGRMTERIFWTQVAAAALCVSLVAAVSSQSTSGEPAEPIEEQEADRQGAVAGEAPPADVQTERSPEGEGQVVEPRAPAVPPARGQVKPRLNDAAEHLARIEAIVSEALAGRPATKGTGEQVGTTGTPMTEPSGDVLVIERSKMEEIRMHLEQLRTALAQPPKRPQP